MNIGSDIIYPVGADIGNGFVKIRMLGKSASILSGYTIQKPDGLYYPDSHTIKPPVARHITVNGKSVWVGRDCLNGYIVRYTNQYKYQKDNLRILFSAGLSQWIVNNGATVSGVLRLHVTCGMPTGYYANSEKRARAIAAYRAAFGKDKWTIEFDDQEIVLKTALASVLPETDNTTQKLEDGYTVIVDCGSGTLDVSIYHNNGTEPIKTVTIPHGLGTAFDNIRTDRVEETELLLLAKQLEPSCIDGYIAHVKTVVGKIVTSLESHRQPVSVRLIGGLTEIMSKEQKKDFSYGMNVSFYGADESAKAFFANASGIKQSN